MRRHRTWYLRLRIPADLQPALGHFLVRTLRTTDAAEAKYRAAILFAAARKWWPVLREQAMALVLGKTPDQFGLQDLVRADPRTFLRDAMALDDTLRAEMMARLEVQLHAWDGFVREEREFNRDMREVWQDCLDARQQGRERALRDALADREGLVATVPATVPAVPAPAAPVDPRAKLTLGELAADFLGERDVSEATRVAIRQVTRDFHVVVGPKGIGALTAADVAEYKKWLLARPGRAGRERAAPATVQRNLNFIRSMLTWAHEDAGILAANPGERVKPPKKTKKEAAKPRRLPLGPEHLVRLFASPLYTGCAAPQRWSVPGRYRAPADLRFFMLAMFLSGARTEELPDAGIHELDGIACLDLRQTGTKTAAGARLVPILPDLRKCGFLVWARERLASGRTLFAGADCPADWSQWTGRYLDAIGIDDPLLTPYSLRHSFRVMLRNGNLNRETANRIFGHEEGTTGEDYGRGLLQPDEARAFLSCVKPSTDLSHLHVAR